MPQALLDAATYRIKPGACRPDRIAEMCCGSTSGCCVTPAWRFPDPATPPRPSKRIWRRWRQAARRALCLGGKDRFTATELFENTLLGVIGTDGWTKIHDDSFDWRGPQLRQALSQFAQIVSLADPNAGGLTWDQAAKKLATGQCAFLSMNDSVYGELVANRSVEGKDFGYVPYPGTTGAYLAIVDTFVVSSDAKDGVNAMKFMATIADPKTSLEFNKLKGSVPIRNDVDVSSLPAYQRQASESLWKDKILLSITHGELMSTDFQHAVYDAVATFVESKNTDAFIDTLQNSIEVPSCRTMTSTNKTARCIWSSPSSRDSTASQRPRLSCGRSSASARRSSRGLMVTTRNSGPSWRRGHRPATGTSIEFCRVSMNASAFLLLHVGRHRVVERLLEVRRHQLAMGDRQQDLVTAQRLRRLTLIGGQRCHVDVVADRHGPLDLVELQRCLRVGDGLQELHGVHPVLGIGRHDERVHDREVSTRGSGIRHVAEVLAFHGLVRHEFAVDGIVHRQEGALAGGQLLRGLVPRQPAGASDRRGRRSRRTASAPAAVGLPASRTNRRRSATSHRCRPLPAGCSRTARSLVNRSLPPRQRAVFPLAATLARSASKASIV